MSYTICTKPCESKFYSLDFEMRKKKILHPEPKTELVSESESDPEPKEQKPEPEIELKPEHQSTEEIVRDLRRKNGYVALERMFIPNREYYKEYEQEMAQYNEEDDIIYDDESEEETEQEYDEICAYWE